MYMYVPSRGHNPLLKEGIIGRAARLFSIPSQQVP